MRDGERSSDTCAVWCAIQCAARRPVSDTDTVITMCCALHHLSKRLPKDIPSRPPLPVSSEAGYSGSLPSHIGGGRDIRCCLMELMARFPQILIDSFTANSKGQRQVGFFSRPAHDSSAPPLGRATRTFGGRDSRRVVSPAQLYLISRNSSKKAWTFAHDRKLDW